jgi:hypothetical protein
MRSANSRRGAPRFSPAEYLLWLWPNCESARQAIVARRALKGRSIFLWFHGEIYRTLHEMDRDEHEREILVRLMRATTTRTICKLTTESRSLRGIELGKARVFIKRRGNGVRPGRRQGPRRNDPTYLHRGLLGWFLWRDPAWFLKIKGNRRFPRHACHLEKQIEFIAQSISAVLAGYQPTTGIRRLSEEVVRCYNCRKPAITRDRSNGTVPWCGEC